MKRTEPGTPILSWCMIVRNAESTLEQTLQSIRERTPQAEIVIVDTMSSDRSPEIAQKYADVWVEWRGPNGDWDREMPWFSDAAAARQKSFELASGRWRAWIDSDDRLPGPEEAEKLLKLNARWQPAGKQVVKGDEKPVGLEDLLLQLEQIYPDADVVWAPYLYAKDANGQAYTWQERERIVKWSNPPKWRWSEKAHEILVPVDGYTPPRRIDFAHLLFVHERKFDDASTLYSTKRHFDVLHKQYLAGEGTTRRCLYLAAYAQTLCPQREQEFIEAAHRAATNGTDRYRALSALGQMFVRQGMMVDALETFGAANSLRSDLPDVWFQGAESWLRTEDWVRTVDWLEKGIACKPNTESYVNPRHCVIRYPTMLAEVYQKLARVQIKAGMQEQALSSLSRAVELMGKVLSNPAVGVDIQEAEMRRVRYANTALAQANAINLGRLLQYLIDNDEPKKALEMLKLVPWNLQDHPIVIEYEKKLAPVAKHISNPDAYRMFYESVEETGYVESPEEWLEPKNALARAHWIANYLNAVMPNATILDMGCFDGIVGVPILKMCPGIKYVGVDVHDRPIARFQKRVEQLGMQDRVVLMTVEDFKTFSGKNFDGAIWSEVIEHVADPVFDMRKLLAMLKPDGKLFVTTPWGSFDAGHPPATTAHGLPRDSRGHVRVITARDMVDIVEFAGGKTEDLAKLEAPMNTLGDSMHVVVSNRKLDHNQTPAAFVVPGALWDWNGRSLEAYGMGASEKSIVQVGTALAGEHRRVDVFGPVPCEDVYKSVRYWPKEQLRHLNDGKVVISRSPGFAPVVDSVTPTKLPKILWLQDAFYPDLNPEVAKNYEKIVVVSNWHKQAMHELHGVPLEQMEVIYNPIDPSLYQKKLPRKKDHFIYCSSPDRGLIPLLRMWPKIRERLPEASLHIFYGWKGCEKLGLGGDPTWSKRYENARREFEVRRHQPGILVRDMVSPEVLADAFLTAGVWAYPVIDFNETCCTAALEARAAGAIPVCPPLAALHETAVDGITTAIATGKYTEKQEDQFVDACFVATTIPDSFREAMQERAWREHSIAKSVEAWRRLL